MSKTYWIPELTDEDGTIYANDTESPQFLQTKELVTFNINNALKFDTYAECLEFCKLGLRFPLEGIDLTPKEHEFI